MSSLCPTAAPHTFIPPLISLVLPLILRVFNIKPCNLFIPLGIFALISEKGYRDTLERFTPELSEHTGPFSHIGVCLLAHIFVKNIEGWRGEVLFWTVFARWAFGLTSSHRVGITLFREAYTLRFRCAGVRVHAFIVATMLTPMFVTESMKWVQVAAVWLHFYHSMGYMFAFGVYFCFPTWRSDLVEECKRKEVIQGERKDMSRE